MLPFLVAANITDKVVADVSEENATPRRELESLRKSVALFRVGRAVITGPGGSATPDRGDAPDLPDPKEKIVLGNRNPPALASLLDYGGNSGWYCDFDRAEQIGFGKEDLEAMECWAHGMLLFKFKDFFATYEQDGFSNPGDGDQWARAWMGRAWTWTNEEDRDQRHLYVWQEERDQITTTVLHLYEPDMNFSEVRGGWIIQLKIEDPFRGYGGNPFVGPEVFGENGAPRPGFAEISSLEMCCIDW